MKDLLEDIVKKITGKPDEVSVDEKFENDSLSLVLKVADEDYGTIVGKGGRAIKALRDLLRLRAQKENIKFSLTLVEPVKAA